MGFPVRVIVMSEMFCRGAEKDPVARLCLGLAAALRPFMPAAPQVFCMIAAEVECQLGLFFAELVVH